MIHREPWELAAKKLLEEAKGPMGHSLEGILKAMLTLAEDMADSRTAEIANMVSPDGDLCSSEERATRKVQADEIRHRFPPRPASRSEAMEQVLHLIVHDMNICRSIRDRGGEALRWPEAKEGDSEPRS